MNNLRKRLKENKGFTLAELLIVVAIIGILVAVSIPVFTTQLTKAKRATDTANVRAAKAAAVAYYFEHQSDDTPFTAETVFYDATNGDLKDSKDSINVYGKTPEASITNDGVIPGSTGTPEKAVIQIVIDAEGGTTITWVK